MGNVAYKPVAPEQIEYPWWDAAPPGHIAVRFYAPIIYNIEIGMNLSGSNLATSSNFRSLNTTPDLEIGCNSSGTNLATYALFHTTSAAILQIGMNNSGAHVATMSQFYTTGEPNLT
jgi:hypothetical protein